MHQTRIETLLGLQGILILPIEHLQNLQLHRAQHGFAQYAVSQILFPQISTRRLPTLIRLSLLV